MADKIQWEYHIEVLGSAFRSPKREDIVAYLNQVGEDGWDAINLHQPQNTNRIWITMKRPMTAETRRQRSWPADSWGPDR